jgi:hypothetical protein
VTSLVSSLNLRGIIALGHIRTAHEALGTRVTIRPAWDLIGTEVSALQIKRKGQTPPMGA